MKSTNGRPIRVWMKANIDRFVDRKTGEVNCGEMVEAWDIEEADGAQTLDTTHIAWEIAVQVAESFHGLR